MTNKLKLIVTFVVILVLSLTLAACASSTLDNLDKQGYTVTVRYDANGGQFNQMNDLTILDVFNANDAQSGVKLVEPGSEKREGGAALSTVTRAGYTLLGWYSQKTLRVDSNGNALDEFGVPCSQSGREQGYEYGGKWDFDSDKLVVTEKATSSTPSLTLYAVWIRFNFEFYSQNDQGEWALDKSEQRTAVTVPYWSESKGSVEYGVFPVKEGQTFAAAYSDPEMLQRIEDGARIAGNVDEEKGVISGEDSIKVYIDWMEGEWFRIYNATQFVRNFKANGNYELYADLDFSTGAWPRSISIGDFVGSIEGNGHKITGVKITQNNARQDKNFGLFGTIGASAKFTDVAFEDVSFLLSSGTTLPEGFIGLFAGQIFVGATFENVSVSGTLTIGEDPYVGSNYQIGLVSGNLAVPSGLTANVELKCNSTTKTASADADGLVTISTK